MNIIKRINKEFDERFVTMTMSERAIFEDPDKVKQFLNDAIRRVLESVDVEGCGNKNCKRTR